MVSVGIRELRDRVSELVKQVREEGEIIEITYHGKSVARIVPVRSAPIQAQETSALWASLDELAAEIGASWPAGLSAADAVDAERREL